MKAQLPWLNKAAGRSAGTIYQSYWGATYTRSMPALFHYPDTEKQQRTQAIFFDFQRIWIPIYNVLSRSISKQQRVNKNPFDVMSSFIYKIFKPYSINPKEKYPSNFGLDRLNRVRPIVVDTFLSVKTNEIVLEFEMQRPYNGTGFTLTTTNIILFNITLQSMLFSNIELEGGYNQVLFANANEWQEGDTILVYMALSCDSWLGNFNHIEQWSR